MSKKKTKAPRPPDYGSLASQQAIEERKTAERITASNRPDQYNPYGSIRWSQGPDGKWTQQENWDPRITSASNQLLNKQASLSSDIANQGDFEFKDVPQYDSGYRDKFQNDFYESVMGRIRPEQARQQEGIDLKLRQQGLQPGTEAYDRAMKNLMTSHGDVNAKAALDARLASGAEGRADWQQQLASHTADYNQRMDEYRMPWEMLSSTEGAISGLAKPQFQGFSGATGYQPADMMGAAQKTFEAKMGGRSANANKKGGTMSAAANLIGGLMG